MRKVTNEELHTFLREYEKEIFKMLMALGYDRSETAALMKTYHKQILNMAGKNPNAGSIVTAAMAARIIMKNDKA